MTYHNSEDKKCYFPPLLSNGDIAFDPDAEGAIGYTVFDYREKGVSAFDGIVVRTARRSALCDGLQATLFPFGKWTFGEGTALKEWSQTLVCEKGFFESDCAYEDGAKIHSQGFIHPAIAVYALRKRFENIQENARFSYDVTLCGYDEQISKYMRVLYAERRGDVCAIGFTMYGMEVFCGEVQAFVDKDFEVTPLENGVRISFDAMPMEEVSFYYMLADDKDGANFNEILKGYKQKIDACGFAGLLAECEAHYREFFDMGYVKTSDDMLNRIYKTSLYGIKCNTTPYSIAVGLNNGSWDGRFFGFDEFTSFSALLGANRLSLAKRVPQYRLTCLTQAIGRASDCHRNADTEDMARYHWEAGESGTRELAPDGNWIDHVFHIPKIGIAAFRYYEYSADVDFLKECYPMIRACAKFFTKHMVYRDGDKLYIGKCTDLERLGSSVENPFMTACGAIKLLRCLVKAAEILRVDEAYAKECAYTAQKLYENLPIENEMYVPHLYCKQKSIAVFAGKFPFDVLDDGDEKMLRAWEDFEKNGAAYGNMYPTGNGISPWYAGWKAVAYARAKQTEAAYHSLKQAYRSVGVFDEMFEINETHCRMRPWFSTAAGIFVTAVNEMLLQSDGRTIHILPAFPHNEDVSFSLAAVGGVTVEADVRSGKLQKILVLKNGQDVTDQFEIKF